jgi:MFS family permease
MKIVRHCFPLSKLALAGGFVGGCQSLGLVAAPAVGGVLIDAFSWRACFGVNLPLGTVCVALTAYGFSDPVPNPNVSLPLKEKIKRVNPFGTLLVVPSITCLLMALQWGGTKYGWKDWRIIVLFVIFAVLFAAFGYVQHRQGEEATLPLRILKNRNILAGMWYTGCCNGVLAMTEYYISIYFQGVRGFIATKSGLLGLSMIGGFAVSFIAAAGVMTKFGYYVRKSPLPPISPLAEN